MSSETRFVAAKTIRVQTSGGGLEVRNEGDPVPEATSWRYIYKLIDNGYVRRVASAVVRSLREPVAEPVVESAAAAVDFFECSKCGKRLRTEVGLKRHTTSVHKRVKAL
jgi:hypothetical protein